MPPRPPGDPDPAGGAFFPLTTPEAMDESLEQQPPYLMAGCVALGALVLYVATLAPTTQFWDTSEYIAAAYVLGIPHPPGNPLFTIIAHTWGLIPWVAGYGMRMNLLAAVTRSEERRVGKECRSRWSPYH